MRFSNRQAGWVLAVVSGFFLTGCASTAKDISAAATPVVVHSGLHEANDADSQQQIARLLDSPAFQQFGQRVGEGVGIGLFNQANKLTGFDATADGGSTGDTPIATTGPAPTTSPTTEATTGPTTAATTMPAGKFKAANTPGGAAVAGLAGGGGMNGLVHSSVQEAFLAATDPQFKAGEEAMSEAIGEGFVKGMITVLNKEGPALGDTIRKQLGPIFQELIREQIAPAIRDMLQKELAPAALEVWKQGAVETLKLTVRPDLQPDVQQNAQNASIGASRGTHQVMIESGFLGSNGELSPHIKLYAWVAGIVVGMIVIALLSLLVMLNLLVLHHWRRRNRAAGAVK